MKALDVGCGFGGWSIPLMYDGWECIGIDIAPVHYPGRLIRADITKLDGNDFQGYDCIYSSLPCSEFSKARVRNPKNNIRDVQKGMKLIDAFENFLEGARPEYYVIENVEELWTKYGYARKPVSSFKMSKGGRRLISSNLPLPEEITFNPQHKIREIHGWEHSRWFRSFIPYPISREVANVLEQQLTGAPANSTLVRNP